MEHNSEVKGLKLPDWFYWILAVIGCFILYKVKEVFLPFIISFVLGYILDPFVDVLEKKGVPRTHAVMRVFLIVFLLFVLFIILIVPPVVRQADQLQNSISRYLGEVQREGMLQYDRHSKEQGDHLDPTATPSTTAVSSSREPSPGRDGSGRILPTPVTGTGTPALPAPTGTETSPASSTMREASPSDAVQSDGDHQNSAYVSQVSIIYLGLINRYPILKQHFGDEQALIGMLKSKQEQIGQVAMKILSSISSWLIGSLSHVVFIILVPIMTFYFLCVIDPLKERIMYLIKDRRHKEEVLLISSEINLMLVKYLKGQIMVSGLFGLCIMVAAYIVSLFFHSKYELLLGCIAGVMSIVPYFGMAITLIAGSLITFFTATQNPLVAAIIILVVIIIVNQAFDNFISPKIVGEQVGLHPLWTLFALLAGGKLFGVMGMLIAVPIAATIKIFLIRLFPELVEEIPKDITTVQSVREPQNGDAQENAEKSSSESTETAGEAAAALNEDRQDSSSVVPEKKTEQKTEQKPPSDVAGITAEGEKKKE
ncbi:MAG: AI-2E family transporter [Vulcanimicrobiota bacterium]